MLLWPIMVMCMKMFMVLVMQQTFLHPPRLMGNNNLLNLTLRPVLNHIPEISSRRAWLSKGRVCRCNHPSHPGHSRELGCHMDAYSPNPSRNRTTSGQGCDEKRVPLNTTATPHRVTTCTHIRPHELKPLSSRD
jgi:hypothetical protein